MFYFVVVAKQMKRITMASKPEKFQVDFKPFTPSDKEALVDAKKKKLLTTITIVFLVILGGVIVVGVITSAIIMTFHVKTDELGPLSLQIKTGKLTIENAGKSQAFFGSIGIGLVGGKIYKRRITSDLLSYEWVNTARLRIERDSVLGKCFNIMWSPGESGLQSFQDCYSVQNQYIFGGSELYNQSWPLNHASISMKPFVPRDNILGYFSNQTVYGPVLERYWVSSNGVAVIVNESVPLHVGFNENQTSQLCLKSDL